MISSIFGGRKQPPTTTYYRMLNDFVPIFTDSGDEIYDSDIGRTCIDAVARNAAKLKPKHIRRINGDIINTNSNLERLLQIRPNQYMNAYDFIYKTVSQLYSNNNAFIYIQSVKGIITGFFPINFSTVELVEYQGELYCRFSFKTGFRMTVPYTDLIHLRRHFCRDDIFGEDGRKAYKPTQTLINTINQGIVNAIKSSARLRGFMKFTSTLRPEDLKKQKDEFVADYMGINNDGGIAALDAKADFTPLESKSMMADSEQMEIARQNAYRYFGVNEKIIQANYNEDEWNAFYESSLEPIAIQLSLEFTSKCFTDREQGHGNEILFEANRLQYASAKTKISLIKELSPLGLLKINEGREIFNLGPVEDGEKRLVSLNYVDSSKANKYQVGEEDNDAEGGNGNQDGGAADGGSSE